MTKRSVPFACWFRYDRRNGAGIGCRLFRYAGEGVEKMISDTRGGGATLDDMFVNRL